MVVDDFNLVRIPVAPLEANPPTLIDPNAVLAPPLSGQLLKPIAGRDAEICEAKSVIEHTEFSVGSRLDLTR